MVGSEIDVDGMEAVILDVGGVLLVPDPELLGGALRQHDVEHDIEALVTAHYGGVAALDAAPEDWTVGSAPSPYLMGFMQAAGIAPAQSDAAAAVIGSIFTRPAIEVWRQATPWAYSGLRRLAERAIPTAIVSNADGTVEAQLRLHGFAQVGPGAGLPVAAITDSAVLGVSKPDPRAFAPALDALRRPAERCAYIGDTVTFDVVGARNAGLVPIHLDPFRTCVDEDHAHARSLDEAVDLAVVTR